MLICFIYLFDLLIDLFGEVGAEVADETSFVVETKKDRFTIKAVGVAKTIADKSLR